MSTRGVIEGCTSSVITSMPSLMMEGKKQALSNIMEDGLSKDLMDAGRFCFNCEQIFTDRRCLEDHICPASPYICSCGTEFTCYPDMLVHSTTHEPGHQVLDHETIKKRRIEKVIAEEEQLKRLQTGDVVWEAPKTSSKSSKSFTVKPHVSIKAAYKPGPKSAKIPQVPDMYSSLLQASFSQNPITSSSLPSLLQNSSKGSVNLADICTGMGAPTVDLWTLYQPVVVVKTSRQFNKIRPYGCGKCGQCFSTKTALISHHSSHVTDKISGCVGCGILLSSKKVLPRFHACNSRNTAAKFRLVTAKPPGYKAPKGVSAEVQQLSARRPQASSSIQLTGQNPIATLQVMQKPTVTSNLQLKPQDVRRSIKSHQGQPVTVQTKMWNPNTSKPYIIASHTSKIQKPKLSASNKNNYWLPPDAPIQSKTTTVSASTISGKPVLMYTASNCYTCRVCHLPFESAQMLQRHKCIRAQEFMAEHPQGSRQQYRLKSVTPVTSSVPAQMNGERRFQATGNIKVTQVMAVEQDREQDGTNDGEDGDDDDDDDDCFIVESGPDKPAEMIYQVTSSVPIKT